MKTLSNIALVDQLKNLVGEERKITALILDYLAEVQVRKLYLEYGFPNLFDFCVKFLGYSESAAYRRLGAVRLIRATSFQERSWWGFSKNDWSRKKYEFNSGDSGQTYPCNTP